MIESEPGTHPTPLVDPHGRRVRAHAQRDVDRRDDRRVPARRRRGASCWSTGRRAPAGCASTRPSTTSTTSRRRSRSRPRAGSGSPAAHPRRSNASSGSARRTAGARRRSTSPSRSRTAASTRRTTRRRSPPSSCWPTPIEWMNANGGLEWAASRCDQSAEIDVRLGRGERARDAVRRRARRSAAT